MTKSISRSSVREKKAEALDVFVKTELAKTRAADAAKTAKLRALRLARDEELKAAAASAPVRRVARTRKTLHMRGA